MRAPRCRSAGESGYRNNFDCDLDKESSMDARKFTFRILRFKPEVIDPPRFQDYSIQAETDMSVLEGLEKIRLEQDKTLMYRHSCHHSSCGTCACKINGREKLTCMTKIDDLKGDTVRLTPLEGYQVIGDLVVETSRFYEDISRNWSYLKKSENTSSSQLPEGIKQFQQFDNCIECAACMSACPVTHKNTDFLGPAALAAIHNELKKQPQKGPELLNLAGSYRGEHLCTRALNCSRVCPTRVYPARHIADLRRLLKTK